MVEEAEPLPDAHKSGHAWCAARPRVSAVERSQILDPLGEGIVAPLAPEQLVPEALRRHRGTEGAVVLQHVNLEKLA